MSGAVYSVPMKLQVSLVTLFQKFADALAETLLRRGAPIGART